MPDLACERCGMKGQQRGEGMSEWQPIETAPFVSGKRYLLIESPGIEIPFVGFRYNFGGAWFHDGYDQVQPTHWMPLPQPPAEGRDKEAK